MTITSLEACSPCGGDMKLVQMGGEERTCIQCGFVLYQEYLTDLLGDRLCLIRPPYLGREDGEVRKQQVAVEIVSGEVVLTVRVICPFCRPGFIPMERFQHARARWRCRMGHSLKFLSEGREYIGWA